MSKGQITHIEFPADDTGRARKFYTELFGWELGEMPEFPGYFLFRTGPISASGGAIGERGKSTGQVIRLYIDVDSIDAALAKVPGLGGKVVSGKQEIQGQGWFAVVLDSEGSEIGLFENLPSAS